MILRLICLGVFLFCTATLGLVVASSVKGCEDRQNTSCWFGLRVIVR